MYFYVRHRMLSQDYTKKILTVHGFQALNKEKCGKYQPHFQRNYSSGYKQTVEICLTKVIESEPYNLKETVFRPLIYMNK